MQPHRNNKKKKVKLSAYKSYSGFLKTTANITSLASSNHKISRLYKHLTEVL